MKLDSIESRLARIEARLATHDERSVAHHSRLMALEAQHRKITWAILTGGAGFATSVALIVLNYIL